MYRNDGLILPDGERVSLHPLITIGMTDDWRIGCYWQNSQLENALRQKLSIPDMVKIKEGIMLALRQSLDKRFPTTIDIS